MTCVLEDTRQQTTDYGTPPMHRCRGCSNFIMAFADAGRWRQQIDRQQFQVDRLDTRATIDTVVTTALLQVLQAVPAADNVPRA